MRASRWVRCGVVAAMVALVGACGGGGATDDNSALGHARSGKLTIGVARDQPGLGFRDLNGHYGGLDVDVARYVAKELGVDESGITWKDTQMEQRGTMITSGAVDFVIDAYSITDGRKQTITFAGPYFIAGQDLLVRLDDHSITGPETLNGKKLCSVKGTTSAQAVKDRFAKGTQLVEYNRFSDCVTALLASIVDAVTTDDTILAGYAAQNPELLRVVGKPFTQERYGIGLKKGDNASRDAINAAIEKMISSGAWRDIVQRNLGGGGYKIPPPPQVTER
ncbi:glutamate ABC transporter substrate-binding protein [Gandjariella thermophila]|uniref:ABC transporter substrate-binding protein n=1 Tax=Gandjariella thermophila TaxID=1931992 RepID=A0A4D4J3K9_9PSEU|nr:glutamate ABC transporter substrate-binding protein [Gandjariella thermophila]GDY29690.1 ABC transporter substrate-binding protein [Gandjariella thermophila]